MPVQLPKDLWSDWIDPEERDVANLRGLLEASTTTGFAIREVSSLVNSVTATSTTDDPDASNNDATNPNGTTTDPIVTAPDLRVQKSLIPGNPVNPDLVAGEQFEYLIEIFNDGPSTALADITLADTMPFLAYPTLLDHNSPSLNFDTIDDNFYLYATRFNAGTSSLDRDLVRYPIEIIERTIEPSVWSFDADAGGWEPDFDIDEFTVDDGTLKIVSTGDDPYLSTTGLALPADYATVTITMAVDGPDNFAQLFFHSEDRAEYGDGTVIGFEVVGGGEMRTYELDVSTIPAWNGQITALRFDPVTTGNTTIEIDEITVGP